MRIFLDPTTGTWGGADNLVFLDVTDEEQGDLVEMSDSEISEFATDSEPAALLVSLDTLREWRDSLLVGMSRTGDYLASLDATFDSINALVPEED